MAFDWILNIVFGFQHNQMSNWEIALTITDLFVFICHNYYDNLKSVNVYLFIYIYDIGI